jgi:hypothetical protein
MDKGRDLLIYFPGRSQGAAIQQIDRGWHKVREIAGLSDDVTPYCLRHSRATWMMKQGVDMWEAAPRSTWECLCVCSKPPMDTTAPRADQCRGGPLGVP